MFEWNEENLSKLTKLLETETKQSAADQLGCHIATVKRAIKRLDIKYKKKSGGHFLYKSNPLDPNLILSPLQSDLLTGSLLGDGCMFKNGTFRIKQKSTREEYVNWLHDILSPFSTPVRTESARKPIRMKSGKLSHKLEDWKGEYSYTCAFDTRQHKVLQNLRDRWYPEGRKILPSDIELNSTILNHWYLQDGCHNQQRHFYKLSTQSFSENDVRCLSNKLNKFLGINSCMQFQEGKPVIYITKTNGEDVMKDFLRHLLYLIVLCTKFNLV